MADLTIPQPPNSGQSPSESEQLMRFQGGYCLTEAPPQGEHFSESAPPFAGEATPAMARGSRNLQTDDYQLAGGLAPESVIHPEIDHFNGEQFYTNAEESSWLGLKRKPLRD